MKNWMAALRHRAFRLAALALATSWTLVTGSLVHARLMGRWSFDANYNDSSGRGSNFVVSGGTVPLVPGRFGNAASLDGLASQLTIATSGLAGGYTSFTLGAHVFVQSVPTGGGDAAVLADPGLHAGITYHVDQRFYGYTGGGARHVVTPTANAPGVWRHVVQTYNGATQQTKLFVDGVVVDATASQTPPTSINLSSLRIGRIGSASFLPGKVDEAFLFDEVLTDAQIAALASPPPAAPARVWLSRSATQPLSDTLNAGGSLEVDLLRGPSLTQGESAAFTIWAQPARDAAGFYKQLQNISLNLVTTGDPVVDILDNIVIENPGFNINGAPGVDVTRFAQTFDSAYVDINNPTFKLETLTPAEIEQDQGYPDFANGIVAASPTVSGVREGVGLGPWPLPGDPTSVMTSFGPVYRLGTFSVKSMPQTGDVNLHLQLGASGMSNAGEHTADAQVIFAPPGQSGPIYNAGLSGDRDETLPGDAADIAFRVSDTLVGDYNGDQAVDGADLLLWQRRIGQSALPIGSGADGNRNGIVDAGDLGVWKRNFGRDLSGSQTLQQVPEPSTWGLALVLTATVVLRRRTSAFAAAFTNASSIGRLAHLTYCLTLACIPLLFAFEVVSLQRAHGANIVWDGGGTNRRFSQPDNWSPNQVPGISDTATIGAVGAPKTDQVNVDGNFFLNALRFNNSSENILLTDEGFGSHFIQVGSGGISLLSNFTGNRVTITPEIVMAGSQTWDVPASRSLHVTRQINMNGNNIVLAGAGESVLSGSIIGGGATGAIAFNGGRLRIGAGGLSSTSGLGMNSPGSIDTNGNNASFTGRLTGNQSLTRTGNGTLSLLGDPSLYTGTFHNQQGTLETYATSTPNSVVNTGANLSIIGGGTYNGTITGAGLVSKYAAGEWIIGGSANNFPTLNVHGGGVAGTASSIRNATNNLHVAFQASGTSLRVEQNPPGTLGAYMSGPGAFYKDGVGDLTLVLANSHTGGTYLRGGRLVIGNSTMLGAANNGIQFLGGGIKASGTFDINRPVDMGSGGVIDSNGFDVSISTAITGGGTLTKTGDRFLVLVNPNNSVFPVSVQGGIVQGTTATIKGSIAIAANTQVNFNQSAVGDFNSAIAGAGSVSVTGGGRVNFNQASPTWSGGLSVTSSAVAGSPASFGTGPVSLTWGTLEATGIGDFSNALNLVTNSNITVVNSPSDFYWSGAITGSGQLSKFGDGVLRLSGNNPSFTGGVALNAGHLAANPSSLGTGTLSLVGGTFYPGALRGSGSHVFNNPVVIYDGGGTIDGFGNTGTLTGALSGTGGLTKVGTGTVMLANAANHTGGTSVTGGVLQVADPSFQGLGGTIAVGSGATLSLGLSNQIRDNASVTLNGGTLALNGFQDRARTLNLNGGTMGGPGASTWRPVAGDGDAINSTGASTMGAVFAPTGSVPINVTSGTLAMVSIVENGAGAGGLTKNGAGTLLMSGGAVNTYTGGTTVNAGTLTLDRITDFPTQVAANGGVAVGNLTINPGATVRVNQFHQIRDDAVVSINGGTLEIVGSSIDGVGTLNLHAGTITGAGGLGIRPGGSISSSGSSVIGPRVIPQLSSNDFRINVVDGQLTLTSGIEGSTPSQVLTKEGAGHLVINGTAWHERTVINDGRVSVNNGGGTIHAGNVTVNASGVLGGNGVIGGNVTGAGRVAPGNSPGILTINGNYTQSPVSTLEIEVASFSGPPNWIPGTDHDQLVVGGTATLGGRLEVKVIDPLRTAGGPALGLPPVNLLTAGAVVGEFGDITAPGLEAVNPSLTVEVDYLPGGATLSFVGKKLNLEFDDDTALSIPTWQDLPTWHDVTNPMAPVPATEFPTNRHDLRIENNASSEQTVNVVTDQERVARLFLGDGSQNVNLIVGDGFAGTGVEKLTSVTSVNIRDNGTLGLNSGELGGVAVNVTGGRLEGIGNINLLGAGLTATPERTVAVDGGVFAPGLDAATGQVSIAGNYTQGAHGVLEIDLVSAPAGGQFDKVDVNQGTFTPGGTLRLDVTNLSAIATNNVYTLVTADAGAATPFAGVEVIDPTGIADDYYFSPFYGTAPTSQDAVVAALTANEYQSGVRVLSKGDADGDGAIDGDDARVFAAVLVKSDLLGFKLGDAHFAANNFKDAFNFYTIGEPEGRRIIDFDDIDGFTQRMAASQSISIEAAYGMFQAAYEQALSAEVPEPRSMAMVILAASTIGLSRRRR